MGLSFVMILLQNGIIFWNGIILHNGIIPRNEIIPRNGILPCNGLSFVIVTVVTPSQLGTPVTPVMSPDFTYYSGSSS